MLKVMQQVSELSFLGREEEESETCVTFFQVTLTSKLGRQAEGKIVYLPWLPEEIIDNSEEAVSELKKAAQELEEWGRSYWAWWVYSIYRRTRNRGADRIEKRKSRPVMYLLR